MSEAHWRPAEHLKETKPKQVLKKKKKNSRISAIQRQKIKKNISLYRRENDKHGYYKNNTVSNELTRQLKQKARARHIKPARRSRTSADGRTADEKRRQTWRSRVAFWLSCSDFWRFSHTCFSLLLLLLLLLQQLPQSLLLPVLLILDDYFFLTITLTITVVVFSIAIVAPEQQLPYKRTGVSVSETQTSQGCIRFNPNSRLSLRHLRSPVCFQLRSKESHALPSLRAQTVSSLDTDGLP